MTAGGSPLSPEGSASGASVAVVGAQGDLAAGTTVGAESRSRADLLRLPTGVRLDVVRAARRRALDRLRERHREEFEALVEDELANPHEPGSRR